jgi:ribosomal protein S18 acetylase RimI-like enzyme
MISIRSAHSADVPAMLPFIFEHGKNQWNYLPEADVGEHLAGIAGGKIQAVIAVIDGVMVGFVTFMSSRAQAHYREPEQRGFPHGYICEVVVHRAHVGKGIGACLLKAATIRLAEQGFTELYIERHEENIASAGMMRKAGFVEIDCFDDPARRESGSRRTTVCRLITA